MKYIKTFFLAAVFSSFISCQTIPAPMALNDKSSAIGIAVFIKEFGGSRQPEKLYLVKLDKDADENSMFTRTNILHTNFIRGNYIYLLNAEPGNYAVVGAFYGPESANTRTTSGGWKITTTTTTSGFSTKQNEDKSTWIVYFPKEMIKSTRVTVTPGRMAFMGEYMVGTRQLKKPDGAQLHYYKVIEPEKRGKTAFKDIGLRNLVLGALSVNEAQSLQGEVKSYVRDKGAEARFLQTAQTDLEGGGWSDRIQNQYLDLTLGKPGSSFQSNPQ